MLEVSAKEDVRVRDASGNPFRSCFSFKVTFKRLERVSPAEAGLQFVFTKSSWLPQRPNSYKTILPIFAKN